MVIQYLFLLTKYEGSMLTFFSFLNEEKVRLANGSCYLNYVSGVPYSNQFLNELGNCVTANAIVSQT